MKIKVWVKTNKVGSDSKTSFEIDDADLKQIKGKDKKEAYINELAKEAMFNLIEWNWEIEE